MVVLGPDQRAMGCMDNYSGLGLNPPLNPICGAVGNKKSRPRQTMAKLHLSPQLPLLVDNTRLYRRQGSLKLNNPLVQQQKRLAIPRPLLQLLVRHLAFSGSRWSCAAQLHCSWLPSCTAALHCTALPAPVASLQPRRPLVPAILRSSLVHPFESDYTSKFRRDESKG